MMNFISAFERSALSFGIAAAQSGRGGQQVTRVIRHIPNRQAIAQIVQAARRNKARAEVAEAENAVLRRQVFDLLQIVQAASSR